MTLQELVDQLEGLSGFDVIDTPATVKVRPEFDKSVTCRRCRWIRPFEAHTRGVALRAADVHRARFCELPEES